MLGGVFMKTGNVIPFERGADFYFDQSGGSAVRPVYAGLHGGKKGPLPHG